jgi:hypothetical protein
MKALVPVIVLALAAVANGEPQSLRPAHFAARPGWHVGSDRVHGCPGVPRSRCSQVSSWAATVRWRDCGDCAPPSKTLATLPADGITITLLLGWPGSRARVLPWPPRIRARDVVGPIEGGPARIGSVQRFGVLHGFNAYLYLFFGRRHPTVGQLARVNAELRSARLP